VATLAPFMTRPWLNWGTTSMESTLMPSVSLLAKGRASFFEPGLPEILASALSSGRLRFSTDIAHVSGAQVHFVAVGTPQQPDSHPADLIFVEAAMHSLLPNLGAGDLVVGKSTVPVGTATRLAEVIRASGTGAVLAWNPEFLREGFAVKDTIAPDRLVYGVPDGAPGSGPRPCSMRSTRRRSPATPLL
jgi:UDPglucose 6-dehydrogenase